MLTWRSCQRWGRSDESGFTLIELLVAMGIFAVLMAIFSTSMADFSRSTVRTYRTSDQTTQSRVVFNLFDKQVRAASVITHPALVGLNWYVEYRNDAVTPSTCTQWVLRTDTHALAFRSWTAGASAASTVSAWRTVVTDAANTTAQAPFGFTASTTDVPRQSLSVSLLFRQGTGPVTVSNSVFVARNSTTSTVTNALDGLECNFSGWRP
jgi:prepilin-type N-terminal cleavage/methylation domain-containing protein